MEGLFYPIFWLVLGLALLIAEASTVQMVAIWFALGAFSAILPASLGAPLWVHILVFAVVSAAALLGTRPFVKRFLKVKVQRTNADRVIGETGVVVQAIENDKAQGRVAVMGLDWSARADDNTEIPEGEKVEILAIEGVKLIVRIKNASELGAREEEKAWK